QLAELAGIEVLDRLVDLVNAVHHERTVVNQRLLDRRSAQEQSQAVALGAQVYLVSVVPEQHALTVASGAGAIGPYLPRKHQQRRVELAWRGETQAGTRLEPQVEHVRRREGRGRAAGFSVAAGYHAHHTFA